MKNIINALSLSRILLGILFLIVVLFFNADFLLILLIFIIVAFSDYFDGKLAHKYNVNSSYGEKIDVLSDFSFIMLSTFSLVLIDLIPFWYLFIIILKMIEFFLTSPTDNFYFENFGHFVALMFYALPSFSIIFNLSKDIILMLTIFISVCAITSSLLRIRNTRGS